MRTKCETFIFNVLFLFDLSHNVLNYVSYNLNYVKFLMLTNAASIWNIIAT